MPNTSFSYLYRDASNYKLFEAAILEGEMSEDDIALILSKRSEENLFLPSQVGLEPLQKRWDNLNDDDHVWHELNADDVTTVDVPPTIKMTAKELVENFRRMQHWDIQQAYTELWERRLGDWW
jgi:hypothetical protein